MACIPLRQLSCQILRHIMCSEATVHSTDYWVRQKLIERETYNSRYDQSFCTKFGDVVNMSNNFFAENIKVFSSNKYCARWRALYLPPPCYRKTR